jgi:cytochrome c oxidase subunit 4
MTHSHAGQSEAVGSGEHGLVHIMPAWLLTAVFAALLFLTAATVWATYVDLGRANLLLALVIATVKATLVALYFMHLRYDKPFNVLVFVGALVFVMIFVSLALMDTMEYDPELIPGYAPDYDRM